MKIEFSESQKFRQWWLWFLMFSVALVPLYGAYSQLILGKPFGTNPMTDNQLLILTFAVFGVIYLLYSSDLRTEIDKNEIRMHYFPVYKRTIQWSEVDHAEVKNYGYVGGWGIRLWTRHGTVYNVRGNEGLAIRLKSGKRLVIGTQKAEELKRAIHNIRS